ncbi:MAG: SAM-dependent methyltransferase [Gammaproteobacteria bacterium]
MANLPTPNKTAIAHSEKLSQLIRAEMSDVGGNLRFSRFMQLALYAPGLGYYSAGNHKFGKSGDFMTAPEISPLFARCVARQCQQILTELSGGDILEFGAGSGVFAKDLLLELEELNCLPEHYFILEISADLRARQMRLFSLHCPHLLSRIQWLDTLPKQPIDGIIFANEVLDAMPVDCFVFSHNTSAELSVTWENNQFSWQHTVPSPELALRVKAIQDECDLAENYQSEINLMLPAWIQSVAESMHRGLILLIDYGYGRREYYHPDRSKGTLSCFYQHHQHSDPLILPGLQDMTAHVDFTAVAESAANGGLNVAGFTTQAAFLLACDLISLAEGAANLSETEKFTQNQAIKTLTLPSEMGDVIKVMGLLKNLETELAGFSLLDRRRDL